MLAPLFWYTGFNQPYQLNTFGNRLFDSRALGLELALQPLRDAGLMVGAP